MSRHDLPVDAIRPLFSWRSSIADSDLPATARHVALALSLYMSERGDSAFPGAVRLAHDTGLSERAVRVNLGLLVEARWLLLVERGGRAGHRRHANAYRTNVPVGKPGDNLGNLSPSLQQDQGYPKTSPDPDDTRPLQQDHPNSSLNTPKAARARSSRVVDVDKRRRSPLTGDAGSTFLPGSGWLHDR